MTEKELEPRISHIKAKWNDVDGMWVKASSDVRHSFSASPVWTNNKLVHVSLQAQRENRHLLDRECKISRRLTKIIRCDKTCINYLHILHAFGAANQQLMVGSQTLPVKFSQQYHLWNNHQRPNEFFKSSTVDDWQVEILLKVPVWTLFPGFY